MPDPCKAALQLEFIGSTCCLPRFIDAICTVTDCGALFEHAARYDSDVLEQIRLQSCFFNAQQTLFKEIMLRSVFTRMTVETLDLSVHYNIRKMLSSFLLKAFDRQAKKDRSYAEGRDESAWCVFSAVLHGQRSRKL